MAAPSEQLALLGLVVDRRTARRNLLIGQLRGWRHPRDRRELPQDELLTRIENLPFTAHVGRVGAANHFVEAP